MNPGQEPMRPLVSVVITLYNGEAYVAECIDSVLQQTYDNFELIVADDASTDRSLEKVRQFDDARIRILPSAGKWLGVHANWTRAYAAASGDYLKHVCHDDLLQRDCLEHQVAMLEDNPEAALACGRRRIIDSRGATIARSRGIGPLARNKKPRVIRGAAVAKTCVRAGTNLLGEPACVLVRRSELPFPIFDSRWIYTIDIEFDLRTIAESSAVVDRTVVASFRVSASQLSVAVANQQARELRALFRSLHARHPTSISRRDLLEGYVLSCVNAFARRAVYLLLKLQSHFSTQNGAQRTRVGRIAQH